MPPRIAFWLPNLRIAFFFFFFYTYTIPEKKIQNDFLTKKHTCFFYFGFMQETCTHSLYVMHLKIFVIFYNNFMYLYVLYMHFVTLLIYSISYERVKFPALLNNYVDY